MSGPRGKAKAPAPASGFNGSALPKSIWDQMEEKAQTDSLFKIVFEEYQAIYRPNTINTLKVLFKHKAFLEERMADFTLARVAIINHTKEVPPEKPKKKPKPRKRVDPIADDPEDDYPVDDDSDQSTAFGYDDQAYNRYEKILALYVTVTEKIEKLKATLSKDDKEIIASEEMSYMGELANRDRPNNH